MSNVKVRLMIGIGKEYDLESWMPTYGRILKLGRIFSPQILFSVFEARAFLHASRNNFYICSRTGLFVMSEFLNVYCLRTCNFLS